MLDILPKAQLYNIVGEKIYSLSGLVLLFDSQLALRESKDSPAACRIFHPDSGRSLSMTHKTL